MTTNQRLEAARAKWREDPEPLNDPPRKIDRMQQFPILANVEQILEGWFHERDGVFVGGQGYLCTDREHIFSNLVPDCVVALGVDAERILATNGYVISEVGKPPEFVLEVASKSTGRRDYTLKRRRYAEMGVLEYWRFDHTGGKFHDAPLAGDRLAEGVYTPFALEESPDGEMRGYSPTLGLYLCWVKGQLLLFDPVSRQRLLSRVELIDRIDQAEAGRDEAKARRDQAEAQRDEALREAERLRELVRRLKSD
jgi:Uma2 family endonuclease